MSDSVEKKLEAAIRVYGDESNAVKFIDPALINDFETVETFDFTIPHTIYQLRNGKKIEVPVQVFQISDDREELENPSKRRAFDKKRASDVWTDILAAREKAEKSKKNKSGKKADKVDDESVNIVTKETSKAQELKAIEKKVKENAKKFAKEMDAAILEEKLKNLSEQKLIYQDDSSVVQEQQKLIYDLQAKQDATFELLKEMQSKHEKENESLKANLAKSHELLKKSKEIIQMYREGSSTNEEPSDLNLVKPSGLSVADIGEGLSKNNNFSDRHSIALKPTIQSLAEIDNFSGESANEIGVSFDSLRAHNSTATPKKKSDLMEPSTSKSYSFPNVDSEVMEISSFRNQEQENILMNHDECGLLDKSRKQSLQDFSEKNKGKTSKPKLQSSDEDDGDSKGREKEKRKKRSKKARDLQRKYGKDQHKSQSEEEGENSDSDNYSAKTGAKRKKYYGSYIGTKKYKDMHSSSESDSESEGKGKKKGKKKFTRSSDDEYLSDNLFNPEGLENYKAWTDTTGKQEKHMFHLKHGISIKYKHWDELKNTMRMKEFMRILIHAIFKEHELLAKVFSLAICKAERVPGIVRSEFTREEKAAIRKTFFLQVDKYVKNKKEAKMYKNHWKTYISDHINALLQREKSMHAKALKARKAKKARQQESSVSSSDEA